MKAPGFIRQRRNWFRSGEVFPPLAPRKSAAACCLARALPDGRLPIGWCSEGCIRRPSVWAARLRGEAS